MGEANVNRRIFLKSAILSLAMGGACGKVYGSAAGGERFPISMNSGTLKHYALPVDEQICLCAEAGYDGVELWMPDIVKYIDGGGTCGKIRGLLDSCGLKLYNILGFALWCHDDPKVAADGFAQIKREILVARDLKCGYLAATGYGMEKLTPEKLEWCKGRYRELLDFAAPHGVVPLLELWGHRAWHRLDDVASIAIGAGRPNANLLLDFYHLYRGGNSFDSLNQINCAALPVFHINDYPAVPEYYKLTDADRVFPGDGICDFQKILPQLYANGFRGALSVELFNKGYWSKYSPSELLKVCRQKTESVIKKSFA